MARVWRLLITFYFTWQGSDFISHKMKPCTDTFILLNILCFHYHSIKNKRCKPFNTESLESGKWKKITIQKALPKYQVCAILHKRNIREHVSRKFTKPCMETPSWYPFEEHKRRTISFRETLSYFRKWRHNAVNLSTRTTRGEWFKLISGKIVLIIFFLRPKSRRKFRLNNWK